ncbi:MAG: 3-dehydroquinate synthase [Gammaproteobacteria bacterium]
MRILAVALGERSYPIYIGRRLLQRSDLLASRIRGRQVLTVTNETIAPLYLQPLQDALKDYNARSVVLPDGEAYKTLEVMDRIITALLEHRFDRSSTLLALGGGVVGDITGFAAACYQRGVDYIQLPTTLLAQVDSAVGGKTAVNHSLGKNMIGAFHQPQCVLSDTATLHTLPARELSAGLAEVIKYGLIRDLEFFSWLEQSMPDLQRRDQEALAYCIYRCCENKAAVVAEDEREVGTRALLNLGHTFGHAIETGLGYGQWLHGEAVAVGMRLAADLSARMGWISAVDRERIESLLVRAGLPIHAPSSLAAERLLELMAVDKKARKGMLRLVLLQGIGRAVITSEYEHSALLATLASARIATRVT